ncbi:hypothetical protein [Nostoc sp.]|uniref:hypothetical protein n=1 Tax=Nostoc sp. TaxID=1180 RepID=UPI002FFBBD29
MPSKESQSAHSSPTSLRDALLGRRSKLGRNGRYLLNKTHISPTSFKKSEILSIAIDSVTQQPFQGASQLCANSTGSFG